MDELALLLSGFWLRVCNPCFMCLNAVSCAQCVEVMLSLISDSLDAWRTRQYDYYQRVLNGIL
jgi:hypothetical protein